MNEAIEIMVDFRSASKALRAELKECLKNLYEDYFLLCGYNGQGASAPLVEVVSNGMLIQIVCEGITVFPIDYDDPLADYIDKKNNVEYKELNIAQIKKIIATIKAFDRCELAKAICKETIFSTP